MFLKGIRFFLVPLSVLTSCFICFIFMPIIYFHPRKIYIMSRLLGVPVLKILGIKINLEGRENIKTHHPCIYLGNHQSVLDIFICSSIWPYRTVSLGKRSLVWIPFFGQLYWMAGNILIVREKRKKAFEALAKAAEKILKKNVSVWIFPEGTRSRGRGLLPFKKGAFHTAIQIQRPLVPIVVADYQNCLDFSRIQAGTVTIRFLPPISTKGMTVEDVNPLLQTCFKIIEKELARL